MNCEKDILTEVNDDSLKGVPGILDSITLDIDYKTVTNRYFSRRYCINVNGIPNNDHQLLFHSNRICIVTLAPSHPLFKNDIPYTVSYQVDKVDRSKTTVKGKGKKGAQIVSESSVLSIIKCENGTEYNVSSCIKGKLIEVNETLIKNPTLLKCFPDSDGFVAIILSNISTSDSRKGELLTPEEYQDALTKR